jgi:hypothetical protein
MWEARGIQNRSFQKTEVFRRQEECKGGWFQETSVFGMQKQINGRGR